jgi:hypothetical protein
LAWSLARGARADNDALLVNVAQDRRCLEMHIEAMESSEGRVGKEKEKWAD